MQGTRAIGESDRFGKGGSTLRRKAALIGFLVAVALPATVLGFEAYFSDAAGSRITQVWEGALVHIAVLDEYKTACGIDSFSAKVVIFDFKTGAYYENDDVQFVETGYEQGVFVWDQGALPVGARKSWTTQSYTYPYEVGDRTITEIWAPEFEHVTHPVGATPAWADSNWEYIDEDASEVSPGNNTGVAKRYQFAEFLGRFENNDTLVVLVYDLTDPTNVAVGQLKIQDTPSAITVQPATVFYGCADIIVEITDKDEDLSCDRTDYVPFFVIVNPGSWNPGTSSTAPSVAALAEEPPPPPPDVPPPPPPPPPEIQAEVNNFCGLVRTGGVDPESGEVIADPIRWYNAYDMRYIQYPYAEVPLDELHWSWAPPARTYDIDGDGVDENVAPGVARVVFYAAETSPTSGVFRFNFGSLDQLQDRLGFGRFPVGTTIAFYYLDPNDFDDLQIATIRVQGQESPSEVYFTDADGVPTDEVRLGEGLYVRVYDAKQNIDACLQEQVVVHFCDPHGEDDSEYWVVDEVSGDAGIFASMGAMKLQPVWDAVGGWQLVLDSWTFEAFNEDSIFVRYNSLGYVGADLQLLGDGDLSGFPPRIDPASGRNYPWDVSFDLVKVYDFQVFDGTTVHMQFLDGNFQPVTQFTPSDQVYLEVTDLDQNENALLRERIAGSWHKEGTERDSAPVWGHTDARGNILELLATAVNGIGRTAKVFVFNANDGSWMALDLQETGVDTGVFRSTTGITAQDLGAGEGELIVAFYQDPSNHSDVAVLGAKVVAGVPAPPAAPTVEFDSAAYLPGDLVTITVTDKAYRNRPEIKDTDVLVVKDAHNTVIYSTDEIPALSGTTDQFRVSFTLPGPGEVAVGTMTVTYTDPADPTRKDTDTAQVRAAELTGVTGISIEPKVFSTSTTFRIIAEPEGAKADKITVTIYDLLGKKVDEVSGEDTDRVTWDGGSLRNGAYIYVAVVEDENLDVPFVHRGFVYIKR